MLLSELFCWTYTLDLVSSSENKKHHEVQFKDHWHVNGLLLMRPNKKARAKMLKRSKDRTWNANNWAGYFKNQLLEMIFCPNVVTDIWSVKYFLILVLKGCWAGSQTWTVVPNIHTNCTFLSRWCYQIANGAEENHWAVECEVSTVWRYPDHNVWPSGFDFWCYPRLVLLGWQPGQYL